jgi:hypothetical protein
MPSYGRRVDEDTGVLHAPVALATNYDREVLLRSIRVAGGTIDVYHITSSSPGTRRMTRLHAKYTEEGDPVDRVAICRDTLDEASTLRMLEREIRIASQRPTTTPEPPE